MKYLKNTLVLISFLAVVLFSIKSGYAAQSYNIVNIVPTSTQTLELELDNEATIRGKNIKSDFTVYKDITITQTSKDDTDSKKVTVTLSDNLEASASYSILSLSGVEGSMEFTTAKKLSDTAIQNSTLDGEQGISKVVVKSSNIIEILFLKDIGGENLEFKFYNNIEVKGISSTESAKKFVALLKDSLDENSEYVGTLTYLEGDELSKIDIESGISDFSTLSPLESYVAGEEVTTTNDSTEKSLEDTLLGALSDATDLNEGVDEDNLLDGELEAVNELNSAGEDPDNQNTQLEEFALTQDETPDTGAETWVLLLGTFIINTFYFFSRRKKVNVA